MEVSCQLYALADWMGPKADINVVATRRKSLPGIEPRSFSP
jgi:hypothetical protein